ncbi:MAG: DUF2807 domain-containing protein [bacterium]|nr:DUF2807 domain-containing protein [bacterium]
MQSKIALAALLLLSLVATGCGDGLDLNNTDVAGSGTITTETRDLSGFDQVTLAGEGNVILTEGSGPLFTIETDDNLLAHIETTVANGVLTIATESGIDIDPTESVKYVISMPDITGLTLSGAGNFQLTTSSGESLTLTLSGAGDITIDSVTADQLDVELSGVGTITLGGEVGTQDVTLSGAGSYQAADLRSTTANVTTSGAGNATVWVTGELDATVSGVGSIDYYGSPRLTDKVTGLGKITSRGDR